MPARRRDSLRWATRAVVLVPLAWLAVDLLGGGLGADPVGTALRRTGSSALACLLLSLALTPAVRLTGICALHAARRPLGLGAFGYAVLHLLVYVGADYGFDLSLALHSVGSSPYVLAGAAALLLLTPLAATSTDGWVRRLGRNWRRLHRLAYPAAALAVLHFGWTFKELRPLPVAAGMLLAALLILRLPGVGRRRPAGDPPGAAAAPTPARARPRHHNEEQDRGDDGGMGGTAGP
jgi:sulfoxide reductase heme-binding subunit YedZ